MMSGNINYSVEELAERLDMSDRTIYRYIDTFKNAGYTVTKIYANTYKLEKIPREMPNFDKLMYFSEEESYLINSLLDALVPTNSLKKGIKKKLAVIYDKTSIADYVDRRSNAAHVENLTRAAREKKKVILKDYESGNSHTVHLTLRTGITRSSRFHALGRSRSSMNPGQGSKVTINKEWIYSGWPGAFVAISHGK